MRAVQGTLLIIFFGSLAITVWFRIIKIETFVDVSNHHAKELTHAPSYTFLLLQFYLLCLFSSFDVISNCPPYFFHSNGINYNVAK